MSSDRDRIASVTLDEGSIGRGNRDIEHERAVAIYDLLEENVFAVVDEDRGPYQLTLGIQDKRLVFDIRDEAGEPVVLHLLSLTPFRRIVKDYFMICESYFQMIKTASPSRIEAVDMGRRGIPPAAGRLPPCCSPAA